MSQSIRVLIGDDSLELGISWATAFKEAGLYAITRPKMGKVLVDYVLTERPAVVILDAKTVSQSCSIRPLPVCMKQRRQELNVQYVTQ